MEVTIKRTSHNDFVLQCTGGGPGTVRLKKHIPITSYCIPGSSHGGKASKGTLTDYKVWVQNTIRKTWHHCTEEAQVR